MVLGYLLKLSGWLGSKCAASVRVILHKLATARVESRKQGEGNAAWHGIRDIEAISTTPHKLYAWQTLATVGRMQHMHIRKRILPNGNHAFAIFLAHMSGPQAHKASSKGSVS